MTPTLAWIVAGGVLMSAIALVGSITLLLSERTLKHILLPCVAFAAGSMIGGAFFHMLPASLASDMSETAVYVLIVSGFTTFFALEQFLHWHHCHRAQSACKKPLTYLVLVGDGLHNFLGGLAVAGAFIIDIRLGIIAWLAAAAHEVPQELGDFAVLIHGGWGRMQALVFNVLSALTFLVGGLDAYTASFRFDVAFMIPFAAGNFLYIGAVDLIPELKQHADLRENLVHFAAFVMGVGLLLAVRIGLGG